MSDDEPYEERFEKLATEHQKTAIVVLEGAVELPGSADLLRDARMSYSFSEYDRWDGGTYIFDVYLRVDARKTAQYTEEVLLQVKAAVERVTADVPNVWIGKAVAVPVIVDDDVRVSNNALDLSHKWNGPTRHYMRFRSVAEADMFDSLEKRQAELPKGDTFLIVPLPAVWTGQHRREPDFLIAYKGKVGAIEIDDPSHNQRWAADRSRDQLLDDCGVQLTRRVHVEDVTTAEARRTFIDVFLERLVRG